MATLEAKFGLALEEIRSLRGLLDECGISYACDFSTDEKDYRHLYRERELQAKSEELEVTKALLMLQNLRGCSTKLCSSSVDAR